MFEHILVATDGSERSERAIRLAVGLARSTGAKLTALTSTWPVPPFQLEGSGAFIPNDELEQNARQWAARCLASASDAARSAGVSCNAVHLRHGYPHEAIVKTAEEEACDLIVMASHGRSGDAAVPLASETQKVLACAKVPVLVCR